ncbi:hypothetical protein ACFE04_015734 [Oxalis oulophora]
MEQKTTLQLQIISAKHLKDVNYIGKMDVYVVVSLSGDAASPQKIKTSVDRDGGTNPTWNFPMKFTVTDSLAQQDRLTLHFKLKCERLVGGDRDIGEVNVPVKEFLDSTMNGSTQFVTYQVRKPSGRPQGSLNFSYRVGHGQIPKLLVTANPAIGPKTQAGPSGPQGPYTHEQHHKATTGNSSVRSQGVSNLSYSVKDGQVSKPVSIYPTIEPIIGSYVELNGTPTPYPPPGPYLLGDHWATIGTPQSRLNVSYQVRDGQVSKLFTAYPAIEHSIGPYVEPNGPPSPYFLPGPYIPPPPGYAYPSPAPQQPIAYGHYHPPPPGYGYLPPQPSNEYLAQGGYAFSGQERHGYQSLDKGWA